MRIPDRLVFNEENRANIAEARPYRYAWFYCTARRAALQLFQGGRIRKVHDMGCRANPI
jgi:hypothetical protein